MATKEVKIDIPIGYEIDQENSTFECIKFKKIEEQVNTWNDIKKIDGYWVSNNSKICSILNSKDYSRDQNKNIALTEKHCKKILATTQISQLMPYYGGAITDKEWKNADKLKYCIKRQGNNLSTETYYILWFFLAFHTIEDRDRFLNHNERLIKDYYMLD